MEPATQSIIPATPPDHDGVVAAKAHINKLIRDIDILGPMRQRPWLTVLTAGVAGGMLAVNTERLIGAATLTRALTGLVKTVANAVAKPHMEEQPEAGQI